MPADPIARELTPLPADPIARNTFLRDGVMVTPRGYANKYDVASGATHGNEQAGRSLSCGLDGWIAEIRASGESAETLARRYALPVDYLRGLMADAQPGPGKPTAGEMR